MNNKYWIITLLVSSLFFTECKKDQPEPEDTKEVASAATQKLNTFIEEAMTDVYLWYAQMPAIEIKYETDPKAYFEKLLYTDDKWSVITDDIVAFENSLQGIETGYGYSLAFGSFVDASYKPTGNYFAVVEYVYPNSPASRAGFARGDLIIRLNDANITSGNYKQLLSGTTISVTKGTLTSSGIATAGTLSMTAEELTFDPVFMYKIIAKEGHKIGYLIYMQYITSYNETSLKTALQYFKDNQITDLVLDLRYNMGGYLAAAQFLCSSIAPLNVVNNSSSLITFQWNDKYQSYWISKNIQDQLGLKFNSAVPIKLGLSKIQILTGKSTASSSEFTITGLDPYMNITLVGDTTYGKYTGSILVKPEDIYNSAAEYASFNSWAIQPIVLRYANSLGVTDFKNGFAPDIKVTDELLPAFPLGDLTEPLLRKAVENITGVPIVALKKAEAPFKYDIFDRGFSRFDTQKRNLFLDVPPGVLNKPY